MQGKGDFKLTVKLPADEERAILGKRLIHAAAANNIELVKALVSQGADMTYRNLWGETPVYAAAGSGGIEVLEYFAERGVPFDGKTHGHQTLLHSAVATGDLKIAAFVASKCAPWTAQAYDGASVLHVAVRTGHLKATRWVLKQCPKLIEKVDYSGWNALHAVVAPFRLPRRIEIIESLLEAGVSVNMETYRGDTVLHLAAKKANPLIMAMLIEHGAKLNCNACESGSSCKSVDKKVASFVRNYRIAWKKREEEEGRAKGGFLSNIFGKSKNRTASPSPAGSPDPAKGSKAAAASPSPASPSPATPSTAPVSPASEAASTPVASPVASPPAAARTGTPERRERKEKKKAQQDGDGAPRDDAKDAKNGKPAPAADGDAAKGGKKEKRDRKKKEARDKGESD